MIENHKCLKQEVLDNLNILLEILIQKKQLIKKVSGDLVFIKNRIDEERKKKDQNIPFFNNAFKQNSSALTEDSRESELTIVVEAHTFVLEQNTNFYTVS